METDKYQSPLSGRYASNYMQHIFSQDYKFSTWRKLWIELAIAQKELGLPITQEQIEQMQQNQYEIDYARIRELEESLKHDVMAHIHGFAQICPQAAPIIHLGATSCYVGDNTDIIQQKNALIHIRSLLLRVMKQLADFANESKEIPCLAYTHFQAAQPTTVGKRATLWLQDFYLDFIQVEFTLSQLKFPGCKGTTGTAASFLSLFEGDGKKVMELEKRIAKQMGFDDVMLVSGQTYTRKIDYLIQSTLSGIAQSASKFANDIRLLAHEKEIEEPFATTQVGSSAMPYKRNPMRCERISSLARLVIVNTLNPSITASTQWLERTLDDSANRRISIPEGFLTTDSILGLMLNITKDLVVHPLVIQKNLEKELPFLATENILMEAVKQGGNRQELHERIRIHALDTSQEIKDQGLENSLLSKIAKDPLFNLDMDQLNTLLDPKLYIGQAIEQTNSFLKEMYSVLEENASDMGQEIEIKI